MPHNNDLAEKPIDFVLILRGLLACAVVVFHAHGFMGERLGDAISRFIPWYFVPSGELGVWCFFVLSGYLMGKGFYSGRYIFSIESIMTFYKNRFFRIVPLYALVVATSFLLYGLYLNPSGVQAHWVKLFSELLFFQYSYFDNALAFNAPLWSIATEVQFYCWVPVWFAGFKKLFKYVSVPAVIGVVVLLGSFLRVGLFTQEVLPLYQPDGLGALFQAWAKVLYAPLVTNAYLFAVGMLLNWVVPWLLAYLNRRQGGQLLWLSLLPLLASLGASYLLSLSFPQFHWWAFKTYILWVPLCAFFVLVPFLLWHEQKIRLPITMKPLLSPLVLVLQKLGLWSYGIYLWHYPLVCLVAKKWISPTASIFGGNLACYWAVVVFICLVLAIGLAAVTFQWIERPFEERKHKTMPLA
jgi:peptidoglycan/LPS O-acetylase OafA/YrhL